MKGTHGLAYALIILVILGCVCGNPKNKNQNPNNSNSLNSANSPPTLSDTDKGLPNSSKLTEGKRIIQTATSEDEITRAQQLLTTIPPNAPEYGEAQKLLKTTEARSKQIAKEQAPALREKLRFDYQETVAAANPHLNYIRSKYTQMKGGYALWATHEFFTRYTFSAGDDAKIVSAWIDANSSELGKAGIVRVGVMGEGPYSSWSYFDVK